MDSNKTKSKPFNNLIFFLSLKLQQVDDQSATPFSIDLAKELVVRKLWEGCNSWTGSLQQGYQPQSATPLAFSTDLAKELLIRKLWEGCDGRTRSELLVGRNLLPGRVGAAGGMAGHAGRGGWGTWPLSLPVHAAADARSLQPGRKWAQPAHKINMRVISLRLRRP